MTRVVCSSHIRAEFLPKRGRVAPLRAGVEAIPLLLDGDEGEAGKSCRKINCIRTPLDIMLSAVGCQRPQISLP